MKRKLTSNPNQCEEDVELVPNKRYSNESYVKKSKWTNKQRILILASRGITSRHRHLMQDFILLLPHSKKESKVERKESLSTLNEMCIIRNCNRCIFFECKKKEDLFLWISDVNKGPSAKFLVQNGSRPILSFEEKFNSSPHYVILRELFRQTFSTPNYHPKSKPFIDHVFTFTLCDNRVWFRNYEILEEDGKLAEIGPRFVLNPIKILADSFRGPVLWENPFYVSPNLLKQSLSTQYKARVASKLARKKRQLKISYPVDFTDDVFHVNAFDKK